VRSSPPALIRAEQIRHRALLEPQPMQSPLAARIDQSIAHKRLQDVLPERVLTIRPDADPRTPVAHRLYWGHRAPGVLGAGDLSGIGVRAYEVRRMLKTQPDFDMGSLERRWIIVMAGRRIGCA
jgi:hypothetical protein